MNAVRRSLKPPGRPEAVRGRTSALLALACIGLAAGILVYLTDRVAFSAALMPAVGFLSGRHLFGTVGQWLPSFVHPFAFSLLSAAALPARCVFRYGACLAWCLVNVGFEVGQHPQLKQLWFESLHGPFGQAPLVRFVANYCLKGTFDASDLVAAILGALGAGMVLSLLDHDPETRHER
jgi:hypothetical protein